MTRTKQGSIWAEWEEVGPQTFVFIRNRVPVRYRHNITQHSVDTLAYPAYRLFLAQDWVAGFGIAEDGELVNVFALPEAPPGKGAEGVRRAVELGANRVEFYDGFLTKFYADLGFVEVERYPFADEFAPLGYDFVANGRPDYVIAKWRDPQGTGRGDALDAGVGIASRGGTPETSSRPSPLPASEVSA